MAHVLDNCMRAADLDVLLAAAGGARGAHVLVAIAPGADDRRITAAPGQLPRQAAGGSHARHLAFFVQRGAVDGAGWWIKNFSDGVEPAVFWNPDLGSELVQAADR